jgi:hypothetical protein
LEKSQGGRVTGSPPKKMKSLIIQMEGITARMNHRSKIITRFLRRVIDRFHAWDVLYNTSKELNNETTLYGVPVQDVHDYYKHYIWDNKKWYFFDIRELYHIVITNRAPSNPYTRNKLTNFQICNVVRKYQLATKHDKFSGLVLSIDGERYTNTKAIIKAYLKDHLSTFPYNIEKFLTNKPVLIDILTSISTQYPYYFQQPNAFQHLVMAQHYNITQNTELCMHSCHKVLSSILSNDDLRFMFVIALATALKSKTRRTSAFGTAFGTSEFGTSSFSTPYRRRPLPNIRDDTESEVEAEAEAEVEAEAEAEVESTGLAEVLDLIANYGASNT